MYENACMCVFLFKFYGIKTTKELQLYVNIKYSKLKRTIDGDNHTCLH